MKDPPPCCSIVDINQNLTVGQFAFDGNRFNAYTINVNANLLFDGLGLDRSTSPSVTFNINSGTTTFTGSATDHNVPLVLNGGTLAAGSDSAWGNASITVNSGALQAVSGTTPTLGNDIKLNGDVTFSGSSDLTLSGNIDLGNGPRTLTADNTGHTYLTGNINLNDDVTFNGSGNLSISAGIALGTAIRTLTVDNTCVTTILGDIVGGGLVKTGSGTLVLSGNNTFLPGGGAEIKDGTLVAASDSALGYSGLYLYGGTLQAGGAGARTLSNSIDVYADSCIHDLTLSGPIALWGNNKLTLSNVTVPASVGCTGGLILSSGTVTLSGDNTYTGGTNISDGCTLVVAGTSPVGTGNLQLGDGTTLQAGDAGDCTLNNAVTLTGNPHIGAIGGHNLTLAGEVSGGGGFTMDGSGTLTLSKGDNPYTGNTNVNSGTLASGADNAIGQAGTTYINTGAQVNLGGYNQTFATLNGGGDLTGNGIMTIGAGDFSGVISGSIGQVVKDTAGTLTLSGKNSYTAATPSPPAPWWRPTTRP